MVKKTLQIAVTINVVYTILFYIITFATTTPGGKIITDLLHNYILQPLSCCKITVNEVLC